MGPDRTNRCFRSGSKDHIARDRAAQDLLQTAREERVDVVLACEIYRPPGGNGNWTVDCSGKAAVVATGTYPIQRVWSKVAGMVAARIGDICFISCYASPSWSLSNFREYLEHLEIEVQAHQHVVIAGDFNA